MLYLLKNMLTRRSRLVVRLLFKIVSQRIKNHIKIKSRIGKGRQDDTTVENSEKHLV